MILSNRNLFRVFLTSVSPALKYPKRSLDILLANGVYRTRLIWFLSMNSFGTTISTRSSDALLDFRVFQTRICTNVFLKYKLREVPDKFVRCSTGQLSNFRPESTSIFPTSPVVILCNYRNCQTRSSDILQVVENRKTRWLPGATSGVDFVMCVTELNPYLAHQRCFVPKYETC